MAREQLIDNLNRLHQALGRPDRFPFRLIEIEIKPTPAFDQIAILPKGNTQTASAVKQALESSRLFDFEEPRVHLLS